MKYYREIHGQYRFLLDSFLSGISRWGGEEDDTSSGYGIALTVARVTCTDFPFISEYMSGPRPAVSGCLGVSCHVGISRLAVPFILRTANKINIINN